MRKLFYCFILASLMILFAAVPASASSYSSFEIYSFEQLKDQMDDLYDNDTTDAIIEFEICNDITFTDTIDIACEDVEFNFVNASGKDEVVFWVDKCLAFDINTYTDDVHLYFDGIIFKEKSGSYGSKDCDQGIEVSAYSDGCIISGAKFYQMGGSDVNYGGAIYVNNDECTIEDCVFDQCWARYEGGGIYINDDNVTVRNCTFTHCIAIEKGAGIAVAAGRTNILIENCSFIDPAGEGIAHAVYGADEGYTTIINCSPAGEEGWWYQNCYYTDMPTASLISEGSVCIAAGIAILAGACYALIRRKKNKANAA